MFSYSAYGLGIASSVELPELVESQRRPDVNIRLGAVDRLPPGHTGPANGEHSWATREAACLVFPETGAALVRQGKEIVFDPLPGIDETTSRLFILGAALGILLHQRGFLVLHSSAVVINGRAV